MKILILFFILCLVAPASASELQRTERSIRNLTIEHAYVFIGDTCILHVPGDNNSVWLSDLSILRGTTLLHNHPPGSGEGPSAADMRVAKNAGVHTMVVTTYNGIWTTTEPFENYTFEKW